MIIILSDGDANTQDNDACQLGVQRAEDAEKAGTWVFAVAYGTSYSSGTCSEDTSNLSSIMPSSSISLSSITAQCAMILMAHNSVTDPWNAATNSGYKNDTDASNALCKNSLVPSDPAHRYYSEAADTSLEDVFQGIGIALSSPRLLSNNAT